ncbi:GntR family transcriptional regulator [Mixta theicola]|uniref:GntR family transcriptional regulator n=1 Tax=Mixta theicola TaxID=1458355 RepID=A0A2K1Q5X6_9GAMM|nr:GntR family transcriptional regulator [Mixta theicola]
MASLSARISMLYAVQTGTTRRDRLCSALRQTISEGSLPAGSRLPSSRLLAAELKLSRVTAEAAYGQLESEGYLCRKTGQGTFVAITVRSPSVSRKTAALPFTPSARAAAVVASGGCQDPPFPYAFAAGSPELRAFPHDLWRRLTARQQKLHGNALMRYGDPQGWLPLRQALSTYLGQARGVRCKPEQLLVLTSSQQALQMLALLLLDSGEEIWMENPGYPGARHAFHSAGARVTGVAVDEQGAIPGDGSPRLIYLTPSHQYPGGSALSLERRLAWLALAEKQQSWIIEDDYDSEFWYDAQPMPAMQGLAPQRTIYLGTFSKSLFPSLRLAWMVVPEPLVMPLIRLRSVMDGHSAQLPQAVTAAFIEQGHYAAHLRLMRQLYHSRRDLLQERLTALLSERLDILPCRGGLQLTVLLRQGDEAELTARATAAQLILPRLAPCWLNNLPEQQGWLLGFSALERAEIISGVNRLAALF